MWVTSRSFDPRPMIDMAPGEPHKSVRKLVKWARAHPKGTHIFIYISIPTPQECVYVCVWMVTWLNPTHIHLLSCRSDPFPKKKKKKVSAIEVGGYIPIKPGNKFESHFSKPKTIASQTFHQTLWHLFSYFVFGWVWDFELMNTKMFA